MGRMSTGDPFRLREPRERAREVEPYVHRLREGVRCGTDKRGYETPRGRSLTEIVINASEGFIPLWAKDSTLRWRFRESSFQQFENPEAAKAAVANLFGAAVLAWEGAAPVKFAYRHDAWDFEIVMRQVDNCDISGCVLARAFFPDAGRHDLLLYPKMFSQHPQEQLETLVHELGHIFGLRHFFAQISETQWASEIFGKHHKFSIMNYGPDSRLTHDDKVDLKRLYEMAWSRELTHINGTEIRFVRPYHMSGYPAEETILIGPATPVIQSTPQMSRRPRLPEVTHHS